MASTEMPSCLRFGHTIDICQAIINNAKFPHAAPLDLYTMLWIELATFQVPAGHLIYLMAIMTLQTLSEESMGFLVCDKLMALLLADAQINALREVLPQLPSRVRAPL